MINDRSFKNCTFQNIFFTIDTTTISTLDVVDPKNDSIKFFGKPGKHGVIIIRTKKPIKWVSAKEILKQKAAMILSSQKKTLIKVNNSFFYTSEAIYFQKELIKNISITNNATLSYLDKIFNSVVTITI